MTFLAEVVVSLKSVVNDPQGLVVRAGLHQLGFVEVGEVRVGKLITLSLEAPGETEARLRLTEMCEKLLRNPVIEDYRIDVRAAEPAQP